MLVMFPKSTARPKTGQFTPLGDGGYSYSLIACIFREGTYEFTGNGGESEVFSNFPVAVKLVRERDPISFWYVMLAPGGCGRLRQAQQTNFKQTFCSAIYAVASCA